MLKFTGLLLVFFCFTYGGYSLSLAERQKIARRNGIITLIKYIRQRIEYFRQPLCDIYQEFHCDALDKCGFTDCIKETSFYEALEKNKTELCYDDFTLTALFNFSSSLGKIPLDEQLVSCDYILSILEEDIRKEKAEFPKKQKLYITLGICLGISSVIILI